jgi:hypothetical protein
MNNKIKKYMNKILEYVDFRLKRSKKDAIGFYLSSFGLLILIITISGLIISLALLPMFKNLSPEYGYAIGVQFGAYFAIAYCFIIALLILIQKKLYKKPVYVLLSLLTLLLAYLGGGILGLLIPAYMTSIEMFSDDKK